MKSSLKKISIPTHKIFTRQIGSAISSNIQTESLFYRLPHFKIRILKIIKLMIKAIAVLV